MKLVHLSQMMIIADYLTILFIYVYFSDPRAPRLDSILATVTEKVVRPNNFFVVFITRASTHRPNKLSLEYISGTTHTSSRLIQSQSAANDPSFQLHLVSLALAGG